MSCGHRPGPGSSQSIPGTPSQHRRGPAPAAACTGRLAPGRRASTVSAPRTHHLAAFAVSAHEIREKGD